jgi:hypothetical protein
VVLVGRLTGITAHQCPHMAPTAWCWRDLLKGLGSRALTPWAQSCCSVYDNNRILLLPPLLPLGLAGIGILVLPSHCEAPTLKRLPVAEA